MSTEAAATLTTSTPAVSKADSLVRYVLFQSLRTHVTPFSAMTLEDPAFPSSKVMEVDDVPSLTVLEVFR